MKTQSEKVKSVVSGFKMPFLKALIYMYNDENTSLWNLISDTFISLTMFLLICKPHNYVFSYLLSALPFFT